MKLEMAEVRKIFEKHKDEIQGRLKHLLSQIGRSYSIFEELEMLLEIRELRREIKILDNVCLLYTSPSPRD